MRISDWGSDVCSSDLPLVVVERVRVVHRLHPPADVVERHRLLQLAGLHRHAHVLVEVRRVEHGLVGGVGGLGAGHGAPFRSARRWWTRARRASSRTLVSLGVMGISPSAKNSTRLGTLYDDTLSRRTERMSASVASAPAFKVTHTP